MTRTTTTVLFAGLATLCLVGQARAGAELADHTVRVRVVDGLAHLVDVRRWRNDGAVATELSATLPLPRGAAVHGASVRFGGGPWISAKLLAAADASRDYDRITASGEDPSSRPRPAAVVEWASEGRLRVQAYPVEAKQDFTLRMDVVATTDVRDGHRVLDVAWSQVDPRFRGAVARTSKPAPGVRCGCHDTGGGKETTRLHLRAAPRLGTEAYAEHVDLPGDQRLWHVDVAAASNLRAPPGRSRLVLVLDTSASMRAVGLDRQLALARDLVATTRPDGVEIVVFQRFAHRVFGRFVPWSRFEESLAGAGRQLLTSGNGSEPAEGLRVAASALTAGRGQARVVLITDAATASGFDPQAAQGALAVAPAGTIVHLVDLSRTDTGDLGERRVFDHPLAPMLEPRHGVVLAVHGWSPDRTARREALAELHRPTRIDRLRLHVPGVAAPLSASESLHAGSSVRWWTVGPAGQSAPAVITGELWGQPFRTELRPVRGRSRHIAGLAFGAGATGKLSEEAARHLGRLADAVTPERSLLATRHRTHRGHREAGVGVTGLGFGVMCSTCCGIGGRAVAGYGIRRDSVEAALRRALEAAAVQCATPGAAVDLETTGPEIVAVHVSGASGLARRCLVEAAWNITLPAGTFSIPAGRMDAPRLTWTIDLAPVSAP